MTHGVFAHTLWGSAADRAAELRRQARVVDDLIERLGAIVNGLPAPSDQHYWRGPAANLFMAAIAEQRERLGREVWRLDSVRMHLLGSAATAEAEAQRWGLPP